MLNEEEAHAKVEELAKYSKHIIEYIDSLPVDDRWATLGSAVLDYARRKVDVAALEAFADDPLFADKQEQEKSIIKTTCDLVRDKFTIIELMWKAGQMMKFTTKESTNA